MGKRDLFAAATGVDQGVNKFTPDIGSVRKATSTYAKAIPVAWGQPRVAANAIGNLRYSNSGSLGTFQNSYAFYGVCEGPIAAFRRAWAQQNFFQSISAIGGTKQQLLGSYSQDPANPPSLFSGPIPFRDLSYRGLAYLMLRRQSLAPSTNVLLELQNFNFEIAAAVQTGSIAALAKTFTASPPNTLNSTAHGFTEFQNIRLTTSEQGSLPSGLTLGVDYACVNVTPDTFQVKVNPWDASVVSFSGTGSGTHTATPYFLDANPDAVLLDFLTNTHSGAGFPSAQIGDIATLGTYCLASGTLISPVLDTPGPARNFLERLAIVGYSGLVFSENKLKIVPYCDSAITGNGVTFTPNTTAVYALTDDDFKPEGGEDPVQVERIAPADAYNAVKIEFQNRLNQYSTEIVEIRDEAAIQLHGYRPKDTLTLHEIKDPAVAKWVAAFTLFREQNVRNTYRFRLPAKYLLLEPMDLLTLTESTGTPLDNVAVRVKEISEEADGYLSIVAEDFPTGVALGVRYPNQNSNSGYAQNYNASPGNVNAPVVFVGPYQLSSGVLQLWIGVSGGTEYGGCEVWGSYDEVNGPYNPLGVLAGKTATGVLTSALPIVADPDNTTVLGVDLTESEGALASVTAGQAANGDFSLCYAGGELFSFTNVAETAPNKYNLTNLRRGLYGTPVSSVASGSRFMFVSGSFFKLPVPPEFTVGRTLYLKFPAFNRFGAGTQALADISAYAYTLATFVLPAPTGVALASGTAELLLQSDGTVVPRIKVTWTPPVFSRVTGYELQFKKSSDSIYLDAPSVLGQAANTAWIVGVLSGVNHDVRIRAVGAVRETSAWVTIANHFVVGKTAKPADVVQFTIEGTILTWSPVADVDLLGYLLRYQPGTSRSWGDAIPLHNGGVTNSPYDMLIVPSGPVVLMVKAVDSSGNESENAAYIVANFGDPLVANIVETFDRKAAGFPGVKTNCAVSGGNLVADSLTPLMWKPNEEAAMWGVDPNVPMWATVQYAPMTYVDSLIFSQAGVGSMLTIDHVIAGDPWSLEYRENSAKLMWDADAARLLWNADAGALMWDQPQFLPWPGQIAVKNSLYDFRIIAGQANTQGVVSEFTLIVDMPDIEEDLNDSVISSGGTRLPIVKSYRAIKNVQLTVQADGGSAISARIDDKNPSLGPLIHGLDASGANTSALVDARVQGY